MAIKRIGSVLSISSFFLGCGLQLTKTEGLSVGEALKIKGAVFDKMTGEVYRCDVYKVCGSVRDDNGNELKVIKKARSCNLFYLVRE
ncbi:MAG: hypothetical protein PHE50_09995 [Dehalococcoidales bacterium]|nr:hypothetical protein [Dehalococcoidales bacterium]